MRPTATTRARAGVLFALAARGTLGGVLLVAGALKVGTPLSNARSVQAYELFPFDVAALIGYALPPIEIALGVLLLAGLFTRAAAVASAGLMVVFSVAIASAWARGLAIDCGCFGAGGPLPLEEALAAYPKDIARDLALAAAGAWLAWRPGTPLSVDRLLARCQQ